MTKPVRLDVELVRRRMVASRAEARRAVEAGLVAIRGIPASKPSTLVSPDAPIEMVSPRARFVSRGGEKLDGALARMDVVVEGRRWLDAGASAGGFTDCLLQGGAKAVVAADVGYGQLAWSLRNDPRVVVMERVNVRDLQAYDLPWAAEGVVADLSFISLTLVLEPLSRVVTGDGDLVLLVKPQFEVGRDRVGGGGVVRDPALWGDAISRVVDAAETNGLGLVAATASHLPGPAGNREFFVHLRPGAASDRSGIPAAIEEAAG